MSDPQRQFAVDTVRKLTDAGYTALWAGGCVRDFLLGIEPKDYDIATDCIPAKVREIFGKRNTQAVGASFGVILLRGPKEAGHIEIATFRTDGSYLDGRRPESVEFSTPEEDAKRRDFTINGMFYDPLEQQVLDYVGGEADLGARVLRAIGNPRDRMTEDKLRMLRAVRFAATLDFELDPATADAIRDMADEMTVVSAERIAAELRRMLVDRNRRKAMELARDVHLLQQFLPELGDDDDAWQITLQMLHLLQSPGFELAFAALLQSTPHNNKADGSHPVGSACNRLKLSNDETDRITWLLEHRDAINDASRLTLHRLKRLVIHRYFDDLLALVRAERLARNQALEDVIFCEEFIRNTPSVEINPPELLTGNDLIAMHLQPGPAFKEMLTAVRDAQLDGEIATREEATALVERLRKRVEDESRIE